MSRTTILSVCIISIVLGQAELVTAQTNDAPDNSQTGDKWAKHYYDRVAQFEAENVEPGGVVLVGSSHIEGFDSKNLLPDWTVINRGISSDRIGIDDRGILHRLDCSVFDCHPSMVVLQNGANDLGELWRHGKPSIDKIDACYREVVAKIRGRLPDVPLIIAGLLPTRGKYAELVPLITQFDTRLKQIAADFDCSFVEMYSHFADDDGLLREEFSREGLHLTEAGYEVWAERLDAALREHDPRAKLRASGRVVDPNTATRESDSDLLWYDAKNLTIEGKAWDRYGELLQSTAGSRPVQRSRNGLDAEQTHSRYRRSILDQLQKNLRHLGRRICYEPHGRHRKQRLGSVRQDRWQMEILWCGPPATAAHH